MVECITCRMWCCEAIEPGPLPSLHVLPPSILLSVMTRASSCAASFCNCRSNLRLLLFLNQTLGPHPLTLLFCRVSEASEAQRLPWCGARPSLTLTHTPPLPSHWPPASWTFMVSTCIMVQIGTKQHNGMGSPCNAKGSPTAQLKNALHNPQLPNGTAP